MERSQKQRHGNSQNDHVSHSKSRSDDRQGASSRDDNVGNSKTTNNDQSRTTAKHGKVDRSSKLSQSYKSDQSNSVSATNNVYVNGGNKNNLPAKTKTDNNSKQSAQERYSRDTNNDRNRSSVNQTTDISTTQASNINNIDGSAGRPKNITIRRCASIDVGELNRKKKGKRNKKNKIDKETLLSQTISDKPGGHSNRSGSVGNRPNSLKLQRDGSSRSNVFPTPVPQKRHSSLSNNATDRQNLTHIKPTTPDVEMNETSPILKTKPKLKPFKKKYDTAVDVSDTDEEIYTGTFPTGEGYRKHGLKCHFPSSPYYRIKPLVIGGRASIHAIGLVLYVCAAFLLFCPSFAIFCVIFPICVILKTIFKVCSCCCCCSRNQGENCACCICGQSLSLTEKFWLRNETVCPQVVQSLIIVEHGLNTAQIVNLINNRLVLVKDDNGKRLYPRFSQKIVHTCSDYIWKDDFDFFIHNHVFAMPKGLESLEDLQDYMSDMATMPLDYTRPLWEVQVLSDFGDVRDTVLLFRMHPCVADGVSVVKILHKSIADVDSVTTMSPLLGQESCLDSFKSIFYAPLLLFRKFIIPKCDFNLLHGNHIHLSGRNVITWSEPFSLTRALRVKHITRSTLNEVLMSVTAGSIRNYFIFNGIPNPYDIQTSIPVYYGAKNLTGVGNNIMMLNVNLPTNTEGVVPRLWQIKEYMNKVHQSTLVAFTRRIFKITHHMFAESLWSRLWSSIIKRCTCIISTLPGPEVCLRISSKQIKTIFYWFPPVHKTALAISFFTYGDQLQMAVSVDRAVLPNPEIITQDFIFQMQSLYDILGNRRIPGEVINKKVDLTLLNNEIKPEESAEQLKAKMSKIHQELQNLKHKLDAKKNGETDQCHKIMKKIENLKEHFRELLVELRKRKAAEIEMSLLISEEESTEDDDDFDIPRRPFRRRALSVSSRLSTTSVSSTFRPLTATTPSLITPDFSPDSPLISDKQVPYKSYTGDSRRSSRSSNMKAYSSYRPSSNRKAMEEFEILEYQYSPLVERRYKGKT